MGLTRTALELHDGLILSSIDRHFAPETYTLIAKKALGGTALLVFTRDGSTTKRVADVRVAEAAVGVFGLMGNKGAVGVRVVLEGEEGWDEKGEGQGEEIVTLVVAHLAAHDRGLERRNCDWRSIVQRLVFSEGASEHYESRSGRRRHVVRRAKGATVRDADGIQIFDTSYVRRCFVLLYVLRETGLMSWSGSEVVRLWVRPAKLHALSRSPDLWTALDLGFGKQGPQLSHQSYLSRATRPQAPL